MDSLKESVLFVLTARETLANIFETSKIKKKKELKRWLMNEATDYEILHSLVFNELPKNSKHTVFDEIAVFEILKEAVRSNYLELTDYISDRDYFTFLREVGPLTPYGVSTAKPLLENTIRNGKVGNPVEFWSYEHTILNELVPDYETKKGPEPGSREYISQRTGKVETPPTGRQLGAARAGTEYRPSEEQGAAARETIRAKQEEIQRQIADAQQKAQAAVNRARQLGDQAAAEKDPEKGSEIKKQAQEAQNIANTETEKVNTLKAQLAALWQRARGAAGTAYKAVKGAVGKGYDVAAGAVKAGASAAQGRLQQLGTSVGATGIGKSIISKTGASATQLGGATALSGAALGALLAWAAVKTYRKIFGKEAQACRGDQECLNAAKGKALRGQVADLQGGMTACSKSKDPERCRAAAQQKIEQLRAKLG